MPGTDDGQILERLETFLAHELGSSPRIVNLTRPTLGRSREQWLFDAVWGGPDAEPEPLILRRDPLGGLVESERGQEYALLKALENSTVPSPTARWLDATGAWLGRPSLIMRRERGSSDYFILNGDRPLDVRVELAGQLCDLLASVHKLDWRSLGIGEILEDPGPWASLAELDRFVETLRRDQVEPYPELELAIAWLRREAPQAQATVLVHADFKAGNVLFEDDRIVALLDWELAHLGDPMEDLGWITQPLRAREHLIAGAWAPADVVERYRRASGLEVDPRPLRWWNVFSTFKTAVMQVSGMKAYLEGRAEESFRPTAKVLATLLGSLED